MFENILPLSIEGDWHTRLEHPSVQSIPPKLSPWLFEQGSLTQKLKKHCQQFRVEVLAKHQRLMTANELLTMKCPQQHIQVREVLLYCDEVPWVYAQTLMPLEQVPQAIEKLISLGEKPLGEVIFNEPGVCRGEIEVAHFAKDAQVCQLADMLQQQIDTGLWGRRSLFSLENYGLLVAEVFLPLSGQYA